MRPLPRDGPQSITSFLASERVSRGYKEKDCCVLADVAARCTVMGRWIVDTVNEPPTSVATPKELVEFYQLAVLG
jgi:hypothetical protein